MQNHNNPNGAYNYSITSIPPPPNPYLSQPLQYIQQQPFYHQPYTQLSQHVPYPSSYPPPNPYPSYQYSPQNQLKRAEPNHNYANINQPPLKRPKVQATEAMSAHQIMAKQLQSQKAMQIFNNPYKLHQKVQVQEANLLMWLDASIIDIGYDWIQVHYEGFSSDYNETIYIDSNREESKKHTVRLISAVKSEEKKVIIPHFDDKKDHKSITKRLQELVTETKEEMRDKKYDNALHDIKAFLDGFNEEDIPANKRNILSELYMIYSVCLAQTNDYDEAIQSIKRYIDIRPRSYKGYRTLATFYSFQDRHHDAAKQYEMALKQTIPKENRIKIENILANINDIKYSSDSDSDTESEYEPLLRNNKAIKSNVEEESTESDEEEDKPILEGKQQDKRGVKGTTLDERVMDTTLMSAVQLKAYNNRVKSPNGFYYRFNLKGEKQKNGGWSDSEHKRFMQRAFEIGVNLEWGFFSKCIEGRVGYQCSNYWRKLLEDKYVEDQNYVMVDKDGKMKQKQLKRKEIEGALDDDDFFDKFRRFQFKVIRDPSKTFTNLPTMHPKAPINTESNVYRKKKKKERRGNRNKKNKKERKKRRKKRRKKKMVFSDYDDDDDKNNNNNNKRAEEMEPADEFLCPINYELMEDPVMVPQSGWTYDRGAIEDWINENGNDPNTRQDCKVSDLIPNRTLRDAITRWKQNVGYIKNEKH